jgi:transposase-like protein
MSGFSEKSGEIRDSDETSVPEKRRKRSANEKQEIVEASFKPGASVRALAAEAHRVHPTQVYRWRGLYGRKLEGKSA